MDTLDEHFKSLFANLIQVKLKLYRSIAIKIVDSAADADDAVQFALIKAWDRRRSFKSDSEALSGWIARIVVTESYNIVRWRMREQKKLSDWQPQSEKENPALKQLDSAIEKLPELYQETVHIALLSNLESGEAAKMLGCSVNTLYQRIYKAKTLLKELITRWKDE